MNTHNCGNCGHILTSTWDVRSGRRVFECPNCGYGHAAQTPTSSISQAARNTLNPEAVAGPIGVGTWSVTATIKRPGGNTIEERHVRAATYAGARAVAHEVMLDIVSMDLYLIDEGSTA
jgi:hypothetical protein